MLLDFFLVHFSLIFLLVTCGGLIKLATRQLYTTCEILIIVSYITSCPVRLPSYD